MNIDSQRAAFAIFGSAARGDHDIFSDRDLLIVSDDETSLRKLKAGYNSSGWSCTAYSWSRLQHAADQGSLFLQHLKQEAKILQDPSDRLANLLAHYSTKPSYKREADGAASLLGNLMQHLPRCDTGPMWTLDVLSVGFRSLAVAKLADDGIYSFSNSHIIDGLARIGMIRQADGHQLRPLRQFKSLYRRGLMDCGIGWCNTYDLLRLIDRTFGLGLSARPVETRDILELALADRNTSRWTSDWYVRCRRVESALWMLKPQQDQNRAEFIKRRQNLFKIVKSPNSYAWHFTGGYAALQRDLSDLAEMCIV